jgi:hypothetical protein
MAAYTSINPINLDEVNYTGAKPEHAAANRHFVERLARAPRNTIVNRVSDDFHGEGTGYYDLFVFPSQYQGGAIPAPVLAGMLGLDTRNSGQTVEESLKGWFQVHSVSREHEWNHLPGRPNPEREVYRKSDTRSVEVCIGEQGSGTGRYVVITAANPSGHTGSTCGVHVYMTARQAQELADAIDDQDNLFIQDVSGNKVIWHPEDNASQLITSDRDEQLQAYSITIPWNIRPLIINALREAAHKIA